ncbi:MAG: hypothetical protein HY694_15465 [Deltaproteobacteria bacterium]|nr:hypothetical protein [Deltaproteobacteria bacterium]
MSAMRRKIVLGELEGENTGERVELILHRSGEGSTRLEIRSLCWGQGIGWYVQKTIILDLIQVKMLARVLRQPSVMGPRNREKSKVIPFPVWREHDGDLLP